MFQLAIEQLICNANKISIYPSTNLVVEWLEEHASEISKYKGKIIAFHFDYGIIVSGETYLEVRQQVEELNLMNQVLICRIPNI